MCATEPTWTKLVEPMVKRCELAAKMGMNATWNSVGAAALGELLKRMAARLDTDIEMVSEMAGTGIIVCKSCGYRAPFYLYNPARKYPGTVHCPKCDGDRTEPERDAGPAAAKED